MTYAYLVLPMASEEIVPDLEQDQIVIAKTLFSELGAEELADIVESGMRKFSLVGNADAEHWANFREDMNKAVIAFVVAGTDDAAPFEKEELIPVLGAFLSVLCEAFA
jgi:hypothetical protein